MRVSVELLAGKRRRPTSQDVQRNIDALAKVRDGKSLDETDVQLIRDTISILQGIKLELRKYE